MIDLDRRALCPLGCERVEIGGLLWRSSLLAGHGSQPISGRPTGRAFAEGYAPMGRLPTPIGHPAPQEKSHAVQVGQVNRDASRWLPPPAQLYRRNDN